MSNHILPVIAPKLAESLAVDPSWIGYQVSLTFGAGAVAAIAGGAAVARWGAARTSQICVAACALGVLMFTLPSIAAVAAGSLLVGSGLGMINSTAADLLVKYTPPARRNLMFSIKQTGVPVGGVLAALMAPALAVTVGWQWAMAVVAAACMAVFAFIEMHRAAWDADRDRHVRSEAGSFGAIPFVLANASLRWICITSMIFSGVQRCVLSFTVVYLVAEHRFGLVEAGVMLSAVQFGGVFARIFWGWVADRTGGILVLSVICMMTALGTAALIMFNPEWPRALMLAMFFILGTAVVGWNGVSHAEAARLSPPGMAAAVAGGSSSFIFAGVLFGPSLYALAYGGIGSYAATFWFVVGAALLAMLCLALAWNASRAQAGRA